MATIIPVMDGSAQSPEVESRVNPSNRFGVDYAAEAATFPHPKFPIIDVHSHINGVNAARVYQRAAELYGIGLTYSMTQLEDVPAMQELFGDRMRFIAVPRWNGPPEQKKSDMGKGFIERMEQYYDYGCRIVKFWAAPRSVDIGKTIGDPKFMRLNSPSRIEIMQHAHNMGMIFMTHVADPDTWFATKYADAAIYGTKRAQYKPLEELLDRFSQPWIAAHMGGWPEDLEFLTGLLQRHRNLYLDTSAAKWMIREVSKHSRNEVIDFLTKFRGRIMFGSDIVTTDEHLQPAEQKMEMAAKASNPEQAFDLYASRYWSLRKLWETTHDAESPIADPDLMMVNPKKYDAMSAPRLVGRLLPGDVLKSLYHDAAHALLEPFHKH